MNWLCLLKSPTLQVMGAMWLTVALIGDVERFAAAQQQQRPSVSWVNPKLPEGGKGLEHRVMLSKALGHEVGYVVWTPPDYDASGKTRYPVVYFLHGMGGNESADAGGFSSLLARGIREGAIEPCICVFPNGGRSGYAGDVEKIIVDELIPQTDRNYPTRPEAASRAVAGFSMGGAGAVRLSLLHPELFCAAGSWGGGLFRGGEAILAAAKENADALRKNHLSLLLVNGDKDRPQAFAGLPEVLKPLNIPHEIVSLEDTGHNLGHYYERAGKKMTEFLGRQLKQGNKGQK